MTRKRKPSAPTVLNRFSLEDLERICGVLNGEEGPEMQLALGQLVKSWQESGPSLTEMVLAERALWRDLQESCRARLVATSTGRAHLMIYAAPPVDQKQKAQDGPHGAKPDWVALALFYGLILNPEWVRLGG